MKKFFIAIFFLLPTKLFCMESPTIFDQDIIKLAQPFLEKADAPFFQKNTERPTQDDKIQGFALRLAITKLCIDVMQTITTYQDTRTIILDSFKKRLDDLENNEEKRLKTINHYRKVAVDRLKLK